MSQTAVLAAGGLACGLLAGASAQFGRLCTFAAIEDALMASDYRRARAWLLAIGVAILGTQALAWSGALDLAALPYGGTALAIGGTLIGGVLFGFGMSQVGTCAFGLLVRMGTGDLRALVNVLVVGITAFAATAGALSGLRVYLADLLVFDMRAVGSADLGDAARTIGGDAAAFAVVLFVLLVVFWAALAKGGIRRKPRLFAASIGLGVAVVGGWIVTGVLADPFEGTRTESLTFVAPVGRLLLLVMGYGLAGAAFAITTVVGVVLGSLMVSWLRRETRWEAFDDPREMRRHLLGSVCMGFGGVLAQGCTIGQGMSAASALALSAPIAVFGMVVGARVGLAWLIEGVPRVFHRPFSIRSKPLEPGE
jgi:uncharacterized membrane protein YedE/YeeE